MTVPPASQLTRRIVPASTFRRKDATIAGSMTSTPITTVATIIRMFMGGWELKEKGSEIGLADDARAAGGIDLRDAYQITGANVHAARAAVGLERGEELYDLSVDVDGDEATSIRVKAGHGPRLVLDHAVEGGRRL